MTSKNYPRQRIETTGTKFRRLLCEAVSDDDFRAVVAALVAAAKGGDLGAAKLLLDRVCGKPSVADELDVLSSPATSPATADNSSGEPTDEPASLQQRRAKMAARIQALSH